MRHSNNNMLLECVYSEMKCSKSSIIPSRRGGVERKYLPYVQSDLWFYVVLANSLVDHGQTNSVNSVGLYYVLLLSKIVQHQHHRTNRIVPYPTKPSLSSATRPRTSNVASKPQPQARRSHAIPAEPQIPRFCCDDRIHRCIRK